MHPRGLIFFFPCEKEGGWGEEVSVALSKPLPWSRTGFDKEKGKRVGEKEKGKQCVPNVFP